MKHCPVTGRLLLACDCGACDDLDDEFGGEDGSDEEDALPGLHAFHAH